MTKTTLGIIRILAVLIPLCGAANAAQEQDLAVDRVEYKKGKVMIQEEGKLIAAEKNMVMPNNITVTTNGTYRVNGGKVRTLTEGQVLDKDGMLSSPDGSVMPVIDHLERKNGRMLLIQDGDSKPLETEYAFTDGSKVLPDGTYRTANGTFRRVLDGDWMKLSGEAISSRDTITLRDGVVVVQKDGSQFKLQPRQSLMMNDGTKALGNGTVVMKDGSTVTLGEGQVITLEGVVASKK